MSDPFMAEIRIVGFNFAPVGWAVCDGQIMNLAQNTALFFLLGTTYGGNGLNTFGLPDLQGRAPMHAGQGPGLSYRDLGETGGSQTVALISSEMPSHSHDLKASSSPSSSRSPSGAALARSRNGSAYQSTTNANLGNLAPSAVSVAGGGQPHNNMQPYLSLLFIIALQGVFPTRSGL